MKKFLIVLTIILLVNPISFAQIILAEGTLVDESFIEIETRDELAAIKDDLTENYILTNDIDLKDTEWEPIDEGEFTGTLIGNDFKIKNMPAKYLEDENLGLFTEIADIKNIDIEVEFSKEELEAEEAAEEESEEPQVEEEIVEEKSEKSQSEEEVIEEESEESQAKKKVTKEPFANKQSMSVGNYKEFKAAIEDETITEIILTANISRGTVQGQATVKARKLVIDGGGNFELHSNRISSMITMDGNGGDITFKNLKLSPTNGATNNTILTAPNNGAEFNVTFENIINGRVAANTKGGLVNAENAHVIFKGINKYETNGEPTIINNAKSFTVEETPEASNPVPGEIPYESTELHTKGKIYHTKAENAKMHVKSDGLMFLKGSDSGSSAIELEGKNSEILVEGKFMLGSQRKPTGIAGGLIQLTGDNSQFNARNGATVGFSQTEGSILYMSSENGSVNISGKGTNVNFAVQQGDGSHDAAIHFNRADGYKLNVSDQAHFEVAKASGSAMGIRVGQGTGHEVNVTGAAKFKIHNKGSGVATDTSGENSTNQALFYNGDYPEFNLRDKGSEVELIADSGVAMHMTGGGKINVSEGSTIIARGITDDNKRGIIDTAGKNNDETKITLNKPAYYDFRNNNTEGYTFYTGTKSEIVGIDTDIALWKSGKNVNLDGKHTYRFLGVKRYKYMNQNFMFQSPETNSEGLKKVHETNAGLRSFSRISGNNAQAVVDHLHIPTNADQKMYAHVTIDEGIFGSRDAYTDEVEIDIMHEKINGDSERLTGYTIGKDQFPGKNAYDIYGKSVDPAIGEFGWVEIDLPQEAYLTAGDELEVYGARILGSDGAEGTVTESTPDNLFSEIRSVVDITPPEPTKLKTKNLTTSSKIIEGENADPDATVIIKINDEIVAEGIQVAKDGTWEYEFPKNKLKTDDKVQVFLTDNAEEVSDSVLGTEADRPNRPKTHTSRGNINPGKEYEYHDKVFKEAPLLRLIGELKFDSVPNNLNFTAKIKPKTEEYLMDPIPDNDKHLVVSDTRKNKIDWDLNAKVAPFTDSNGESTDKLTLIYRGNESFELNDINQTIESHKYGEDPNTDKEMFNLSENWFKEKKGMFIRVEPGIMKKEYKSEVIWTLSDAPQ